MKVGLIFLAMTFLSQDASAQAPAALEVSGGYAFVRDPRIELDFPAGWTVGAAGKINGWLSAVGDVSGSRTTISTIVGDLRFSVHAFMLGARTSARIGPFVEFGQFLVGATYASSSVLGVTTAGTHFAWQAGGGLDYPVTGRLSLRGEAGFRWSRGAKGADTGLQLRGVAGVAYRVF